VSDDLEGPIRAICPACRQRTEDLMAHAEPCPAEPADRKTDVD
jgi:hypothetical protein